MHARRFVLCTGVVFVCWDVRPIFNLVWGTPPLRWLMEYVDPRHPSNDPLHGMPRKLAAYSTACDAADLPRCCRCHGAVPATVVHPCLAALMELNVAGAEWYFHCRCHVAAPAMVVHPCAASRRELRLHGVQSGTSAPPWIAMCGSTAWRAPSCHPTAEGWLKRLDSLPVRLRVASRALLAACTLAPLPNPGSCCEGGGWPCLTRLPHHPGTHRVPARVASTIMACLTARPLWCTMELLARARSWPGHGWGRVQGVLCCCGASLGVKAGTAAGALAVLGVWGRLVYLQPKARYNQLHPYTSWIPISAFIVLRNLTPGMRLSALALYGWLGKVRSPGCAVS